MGRDRQDFQAINPEELFRLSQGRSGHAGQLLIHAEVVLDGDRGIGDVLRLDLDALFGLHGLVQAVRPAPAGHQPPGEFINDHNFAALNDVVFIAMKEILGAQGLLQKSQQSGLFRRDILRPFGVPQGRPQKLLHMRQADLGERDGLILLADLIILGHQLLDDLGHADIPFRIFMRGAGNDQGRPGFINQDVINLINDGIVMSPLHLIRLGPRQVIPQIIKAELVVGPIGDIGQIGVLAGRQPHLILLLNRGADLGVKEKGHPPIFRAGGHLQDAHRKAEKAEDFAHPAAVTPRQVIIDRHQVGALPRQRVQIEREGRREGLTLAGAHFSDLAPVEGDSGDQLHVIVPLPEHPLAGLTHGGKGLHQQVIEGLALGQAGFELGRLAREGLVAQGLISRFERIDLVNNVT